MPGKYDIRNQDVRADSFMSRLRRWARSSGNGRLEQFQYRILRRVSAQITDAELACIFSVSRSAVRSARRRGE